MGLDDSNTVVLLHMNGVDGSVLFKDESGKSLIALGNAQIDTALSKFGGASGLFDGTGDYLLMPWHADFELAAVDFTFDFWVKSTQTTTDATLVANTDATFAAGMWIMLTSRTAAGDIATYVQNYSGPTPMLVTAGSLFNTGNWVHITWMRNGNFWCIFVDGILKAIIKSATTIAAGTRNISIARDMTYVRYYNGSMDEFRFSKIARWPIITYTTPADAFTYDGGTYDSSVLHLEGADASTTYTDESGAIWTGTATTQIDTAQYKWGASSLLLDGNSDYITTPHHANFDFGAGDFTVECWARSNALPSNAYQSIIGKRANASVYGPFAMMVRNTGGANYLTTVISTNGSAWQIATDSLITISTNTWYHFAIVRQGNNFMSYFNGSLVGATQASLTLWNNNTVGVVVGATVNGEYWNGWIDEVRISKGIARYSTSFTPPASQYLGTEYHQATRGRNRYCGNVDPRIA